MFKTGGIASKKRFDKSKPPQPITLTKENSFLVFPFDLNAGYITSTENGLRQEDNIEIADYSNFQRIFTGLESMIAQWQGAYKVEKKTATATTLTKTYQVGRNIRAFIPSETMSASFEPSTISGDFLAEFTEESFELHTYEELEERDLFRLFIIPQLHENKWLYVESATNFYWNGTYHHSEITLQTLNNKIAKSGASVESFVQRGAPGEGYAWPVIDDDENVSVDTIRNRDIPITAMQVELSGAAAINTFVAYGRPTKTEKAGGVSKTKFNPDIETPRLLLPLFIETPTPSPENTRPSAETDYYVGNMTPTLWEQYKDWKDQFASSFDLSQRSQFEGVLIGDTLANIRNSNPVNAGTHDHIMWDSKWKIDIANEKRDTRPNNMTDNEIILNGSFTLNQLLSHQFFITSHITTLPLSVEQNIPWTASSIPIIGGFLSKFTLGIPLGWNNIAYRHQMGSVKLMVPSSVVEYGNVMKNKAEDKVWIPLETFTGQRKDEATEFSGINSTGTIVKVSLTHLFTKEINAKTYTFDTKDLGQTTPIQDATGTNIPNRPEKLLWDETCKPTSRGTVPGYVIDMPHFKTIAKMDYRMTFFSNDYQVWTGTYQTKAKFTGNIRDWTNTMKVSNWKETSGRVIQYPRDIVAPNPPDTNYPNFSNVAEKGEFDVDILQLLKDTALAVPVGNDLGEYDFKRQKKAEPKLFFEQEIDLKPYGGTTAVKANYTTISIVEPNGEEGFIEVDVDTLITAGKVDVYNEALKIDYLTITGNYGSFASKRDILINTVQLTVRTKLIVSGESLKYQVFVEPYIIEINGNNPIALYDKSGYTTQRVYTFYNLFFNAKKI